jgi:hypothetical protein
VECTAARQGWNVRFLVKVARPAGLTKKRTGRVR